jgi:hypothetical protein
MHVIIPLVMHLSLSIYITLREDELWPAWQVWSCTNNCYIQITHHLVDFDIMWEHNKSKHHVCLLRFSTSLGQTTMPTAVDTQATQITTISYFLFTVHHKGRRHAANTRFKYVRFHQQQFNINNGFLVTPQNRRAHTQGTWATYHQWEQHYTQHMVSY